MNCGLDLVKAVCYLAFIHPKEAMEMQFSTEYLFARRKRIQQQEDIEDLISSDEDFDETTSSIAEDLCTSSLLSPIEGL